MDKYVSFVKIFDRLLLLYHLIKDNINYLTINNFLLDIILFSLFNTQYQLETIYFILSSIILKRYLKKTIICNKKILQSKKYIYITKIILKLANFIKNLMICITLNKYYYNTNLFPKQSKYKPEY